MDLHQLDLDDAGLVAAAHDALVAADALDVPWVDPQTRRDFVGMLRHGFDGDPPAYLVGVVEGGVVAVGGVFTSSWDNLDSAWFQLTVHPAHRRRGHGAALLDGLEDLAVVDGRTVLGLDRWASVPAPSWVAERGYVHVYTSVCRRLTLSPDTARLRDAAYDHARAHAADYQLVRVAGPLPDELLAASIAARTAINDAPNEDLHLEDEVFTADRVRGYERAQRERGRRIYQLLALHRATGTGAGHTLAVVDEDQPTVGHQHDTSVVPAHRGHRLGLALKTDMLRWLADAEPALHHVDTFNAQSNAQMIAVNDALGFLPMGRSLSFQRTAALPTTDPTASTTPTSEDAAPPG